MKVNDDDNLIVQYIKEHTPENAVVFLTGIGKCYPILRSHKVLNNLHQAFVRCPVVMFFPGTYNEQELILFNEIKDDNYSLQVCLDSGAKKVLLPITSAADLGTVPPELVGSFNLIFYSSAEDAVFKALGVE